jgi:hypothetical protein
MFLALGRVVAFAGHGGVISANGGAPTPDRGVGSRGAAHNDGVVINETVRHSAGVLREERIGRDKVFINRAYLDLLSNEAHEFRRYQ